MKRLLLGLSLLFVLILGLTLALLLRNPKAQIFERIEVATPSATLAPTKSNVATQPTQTSQPSVSNQSTTVINQQPTQPTPTPDSEIVIPLPKITLPILPILNL